MSLSEIARARGAIERDEGYTAYWRSYSMFGISEAAARRGLFFRICEYATRLYRDEGNEIEPIIVVSPDGTETVYPCEINADTGCFSILEREVK